MKGYYGRSSADSLKLISMTAISLGQHSLQIHQNRTAKMIALQQYTHKYVITPHKLITA
jgi:hypothetical protein